MSNYFWLIPFFPALGVFLNGLFGIKYFSKKVVHTIACSTVFLSFLLGLLSFFDLLKLPPDERFWRYELFTWIPGGIAHLFNGHQTAFNVTASFQFDPLAAVMVLVVSGVGLLIHIYSVGYMWEDRGYARYFTYLNLFTFAFIYICDAGIGDGIEFSGDVHRMGGSRIMFIFTYRVLV